MLETQISRKNRCSIAKKNPSASLNELESIDLHSNGSVQYLNKIFLKNKILDNYNQIDFDQSIILTYYYNSLLILIKLPPEFEV